MSWLLNILVLYHIFQNIASDVPPNNNKILNLVTKTYYLRKLATMEVEFAQNAQLVSSSLPGAGKQLINEYMKEFLRANENLTGFSHNQDASFSAEAIAFNPITTFHMVHRFGAELLKLKQYLLEEKSPFSKLLESEQWFNVDDFMSTVFNINHIAHVYNLPVSDVANGVFENVQTGTTLSAKDCAILGNAAPNSKFYAQSILFLEEALERVQDGSMDKSLIEGYLNNTIKFHDERLKEAAPEDLIYFFNRKIGPLRKRYPKQYKWMRNLNRLKLDKISRVYDLCKFGSFQDESINKDLFCWYERTLDPYFAINPLKMEVLSLKPELVQVYEIIGEKQIQFLKEYSDNRSLWNYTNVHDTLNVETVLIDESQHPELQSMPKTLEKLFGLNIVAAGVSRGMRVITYPPGGAFTPHYDLFAANRDGPASMMSSTFLYYVEEPVLGGRTTFEKAKLAVKPIRGSGIFYYNIRSDWLAETNSIHSGCPVVLGRKRAGGKTTYALEQMLTLKCYPNQLMPYMQLLKSTIYQQRRNKVLKGK